jgi:2'-5' RNA ligase
MRLFLAADLDDAARAAAAAAVVRLRASADQQRPGSSPGVAWVEPRNFHLTLHFLGEVDEVRWPGLREALAPALKPGAPKLALQGWGTFPPRGPARVIWMGVAGGTGALAAAHSALGDRLRQVGIVPEARPFSAHLTVGRVKVPSGLFWNRLCAAADPPASEEWTVPACTLFQSHLSPAGPAYRVRLTIPFAGIVHDGPVDAREASRGE